MNTSSPPVYPIPGPIGSMEVTTPTTFVPIPVGTIGTHLPLTH